MLKSIRHIVQGKTIPKEIPVLFSKYNASLEGKSYILIDNFVSVGVITPYVYSLQDPSDLDTRYIRTSDNYYTSYPNCLTYSYVEKTSGAIELNWRILPDAINGITYGDTLSVEFKIEDRNNLGTASTSNYRMQLILNLTSDIS